VKENNKAKRNEEECEGKKEINEEFDERFVDRASWKKKGASKIKY
jgi:hypothetical protein